MTGVLDTALNIGLLAVTAAMALCGWRLLRGPDATDRAR